jgi:DnaK suppressor protein
MWMDTATYKRKLVAEEKRLTQGLNHASANEQELTDNAVTGDWSDASVIDEEKSAQFKTSEDDTTTLEQVRAALTRIEDGSFGKCIVDGGPIEEKRLQAIPWTPYCLKHEAELEKENPRSMPTL